MPPTVTPDVNLLVAASRNDHVHHHIARDWFTEAVKASAAGTRLRLMPLVPASFLRIVTNHRIFAMPMPIGDGLAFIDALLASPGVELATLGPEWPLMRQLCLDKQLAGNALPDAWLAAAVIQQGEHLVTFDSDFRKLLPRNRLTVLATT